LYGKKKYLSGWLKIFGKFRRPPYLCTMLKTNTPFIDFLESFEEIRSELQSYANDSDGWLDPKDLMGCCCIAAKWVADFLETQNFAVQIVHNEYHFWVRCDGYTIDLTASQFGEDDIFIIPVSQEQNFDHYQNAVVAYNFDADYLNNIRWPDEQNPYCYENV
jgi:hypothetical protein